MKLNLVLGFSLAEPVWRQLAGETLRPSDLTEVDRDYVASLICIRDMEDDPRVFQTLELPFSTPSSKGHEVPLSTRCVRNFHIQTVVYTNFGFS